MDVTTKPQRPTPLEYDVVSQLLAANDAKDSVVIKRCYEILLLCAKEEHTVQEIADLYEMSYQTLYLNMQLLQRLGLLQVSPRREGRKNLYHTNWSFVTQDDRELSIRDGQGEYVPYSEYVKRFMYSPVIAERIVYAGKAMVALHINKTLQARGENNYEDSHNAACRRLLENVRVTLSSAVDVIDQWLASPVFEHDKGHEMYKLPVELDETYASQVHDEVERMFQAWGWYEGK